MAAARAHANDVTKGSEIGEDLLVTGGPSESKPGRGSGSIRSVLANLVAKRRRRAGAASGPVARSASRGGSGDPAPGGTPGAEPRKSGLVPSPRQPPASELLGAPQPRGQSSSRGPGSNRGKSDGGPAIIGRLTRGAVAALRDHTVEVLAIVLLGVGGAAYPPIWLVGAALALPSKKWDIRDKFFGITLPLFLLVIGTVLIIVFGGQHASISAYAYEAWLGAERLSRVLAAAGAIYLAWRLRRGRRQPKQPPWSVPRRPG